ncbi:adenosylcobinamide-GDP ribazoletransferase [Amycolatopsis taiwanensis]|uniref:Adenosylcobinamide-GDP ribazoletransferase n=1 Tax=Amycolatopsis taiwanensis TaxID=342230 RepID=A0A9W6R1H8_9PSEU|nr:adenosylcobinamide-GDP ribazoletransferase [Amycolatopsis taiwanensis]GLY65942.1 adenosylcobinamide-GDP ribazoletransferase [Amycolatopsis taiwanensis]
MAVGTLTALPVKPPRVINRRVAAGAMVLAPLAVLPLAVLAAATTLLPLPPLVSAALAVGLVALGSRGLHLDGLADTADGLAASYDRERALEIMRRGDSGPAGVATVTLLLIVQCGALAGAIGAGHGAATAGVAVIAGRCVLSACCARGLPAARPEGLGATVAGAVPVAAAALVFLLAAALAAVVPGWPWWRGPLAVAVAYLVGGLVCWRCVRRFGGITGDVLGACVESAFTAALVALCA